MKKIAAIVSIVILSFSHVNGQHLWQIGAGVTNHWYYMDGDEFEEGMLNTSKWDNAYPWGRSLYCSNDPHYYTDGKNIFFDNDKITLEARKETIRAAAVPYEPDSAELKCNGTAIGKKNLMDFDYTAGMIFSKRKYTYGYYEIRFRCDEGSGLWPAFWLYAGKENYEIDAFEIVGRRNNDFHVDIHCPKGCDNYKTTLGLLRKNWGGYVRTSQNWKDGYNVIGVDWQPDHITWYLNGTGVAYWKGEITDPMWVIADIAIARDGGGFGPGPDSATKFPARFDIDYIRMWSSDAQLQTPVATFYSGSQSDLKLLADEHTNTAIMIKKAKPEYNRKQLKGDKIFASLATGENGMWNISITGTPSTDFSITVTDKSGKVIYRSIDASLRVHAFRPIVAGNSYTLKIVNNGSAIEHKF
ncbi:MAG TPA: glycoside hydrolase family 16 protein [Bacteroidia bacterium]|nr:glycoside hydrolase family 16 protein [Bacteroidia bacterium]